MKSKVVASLLALSLTSGTALTSCDRVKDAVEDVAVPVPFDIPLSFNTDIPFASVVTNSYLRYPEIKMDLDTDAKIKEKYPKLSISNIKSAKLQTLTIDLVNSTLGGDLSAVKNAKIYIKTPNLPEKLVATATNNTSAKTITFNPENTDVIDYLSSKQNSLILEVQGAKLVLDKFTIKINPSFKISVGV